MENGPSNDYQEDKPQLDNEDPNANPNDYSVDDDIYLQELQRRLGQMKVERKNAEQDAKVLDNRLSMLKGEEEKTWKKIEFTQKKANDKLVYLQHMAEIIRQREQIKEFKQKEIENKRQQNQKMKAEMIDKSGLSRAEKQRQIYEEARLLKMQKQYNEQLLAYLNTEKLNNNKNKCDSLKCEHSIQQEKKKILERDRKMKLKAELERKLIEEYRLKEEAEEKKCKVEIEEMEILKRIQTKTQIQQDINAEMEKMSLEAVLQGQYDSLSNSKVNINSNTSTNRKNKK